MYSSCSQLTVTTTTVTTTTGKGVPVAGHEGRDLLAVLDELHLGDTGRALEVALMSVSVFSP